MTDFAKVRIGEATVGGGPPVFLAEIGALFNQDVEKAKRLIRRLSALRSGDTLPLLLKGEILHNPEICLDDDTIERYRSRSGDHTVERYRDLIERKVLPLERYEEILDLCSQEKLSVVMSIYDAKGADFAAEHGVAGLKIASSNITHTPLIRHVAGVGLPIIIDTGRSTLAEVDRAYWTARESGASDIVLEHSPDGHPAPPRNQNLRTLENLKRAYGAPVGLSDHFNGTHMMFVSIGIGVDLIERNIVEDGSLLEQDYAFASSIDELEGGLMTQLYECWLGLGRPFRDPRNTDGLIATSIRMGLIAGRNVTADETLSGDNVDFAFPCKGIRVEEFDRIVGWRIVRDLKRGDIIRWDDVAPQ